MPTTTFTPIATTTLSSGASSISISSIPNTYTHLFGSFTYATDASTTLYLRINDLTSAIYSTKGYRFFNNGFYTQTATDDTQFFLGFGNYTGTNPRLSSEFFLYNYASSLQIKSLTNWYNSISSGSTVTNMGRNGGLINSTVVINKISITSSSGNFNPETTFTLYGLV